MWRETQATMDTSILSMLILPLFVIQRGFGCASEVTLAAPDSNFIEEEGALREDRRC